MIDKTALASYTSCALAIELERSLDEAIESGTRYRREYHGFDTAIYFAKTVPLLEHAKTRPEYEIDDGFRNAVDSIEQRCEREMRKASWQK